MRPEKLVMENFGSFSHRTELDFTKLEDIFLITGKTGAGKTTIFDAICYALYGKVPGSRGKHPDRLLSDHAGDGECFVSLDFNLGDKRYRAERSLRQVVKKKQGEKIVSTDETRALYEKTSDTYKVISQKSEADKKLKELIGLEADEFFKIVLLPQGEFAEFLRENTNERQKVLAKLFPVEKAVAVKDLARKKSTEAETRAEEAANVFNTLSQKVNLETYDQDREKAEAELRKAEQEGRDLEKEEAFLTRICDLRRNEAEAENRLDESRKRLDESQEAETSINEKAVILSRSREARPLEKFLSELRNAETAVADSQALLVASTAEKETAETAAAETEKEIPVTQALEKEALGLREKRPVLIQMLEDEKKLNTDTAELEKQNTLLKKLSGDIDSLNEKIINQKTARDENEALAAELTELTDRHNFSTSVHEMYLKFRKYRERMDTGEQDTIQIEKEISDLECHIAEQDKNIPVLEMEIKLLREEKKFKEQADTASSLVALLEPGKPCPVCGSTEHPNPCAKIENDFNIDDRINAQGNSLKNAETGRAAANAKLEVKKKESLTKQNDLEYLKEEIREEKFKTFPTLPESYPDGCPVNLEALPHLESTAPLPSKEIIEKIIKAESENLSKINVQLKNSRNAASVARELYLQLEKIQIELTDAEKESVGAEERKKNLAQGITEGRKKQRTLLASVLKVTAEYSIDFSEFSDGTSTAGILAAIDKLIAEKEKKIAQLKEKREKAAHQLSRTIASLEAALQNMTGNTTRLTVARVSLEEALGKTDFSNQKQAEEALLDVQTETALENEIRQWRENRTGLETRMAEQEKQLENIRREITGCIPAGLSQAESTSSEITSIPSFQDAQQRFEALKAERAAAEENKNHAFTVLKNLEKDKESLEEAKKRRDDLALQAGKLKKLADDLAGKNSQGLPFDSWLLRYYLNEAAAYANVRLKKMSESRYSLLLDIERQHSRGYAGLDLLVFDAHTGKARPCATLSGGESFMASISLALGLADSIQNRSGSVRLDAVFIDEGFGTLDETTMDKALVILDELRDSRMVGLISHVGELRSRIPCRVEVIKTGTGSRIEV